MSSDEFDALASTLYDNTKACPKCGGAYSLSDELSGPCPHCGHSLSEGPKEVGAFIRGVLRARRRAMGLEF
jgi:hypothetical protein